MGFFCSWVYINDCANEDSDQKAYLPSLATFFIVHLMVSFLHMGNKDSDQARQWLRLSLVFAGRKGHFFLFEETLQGNVWSSTHYSHHAFYNVLLSIPLSGV